MGYRAIKTSESETNFYRRCLNSEPKPAAAPGSPHMEFCPLGFWFLEEDAGQRLKLRPFFRRVDII